MRPLRVLIAEERDYVADRLSAQVESLGHQVLGVVRDGPAAVASTRRLQPDLILLDHRLPPSDGIGTAETILSKFVIPVILLIGYGAADPVRRAREVGVLTHLVWPADAKELASAIKVAQARFRELRVLWEEAGDLHQALRTRTVAERAKKLLMRRLEFGEADAFGYLRRQSRSMGTSLGELAVRLIEAEELWFGESDLVRCVDIILHIVAKLDVLRPPRAAQIAQVKPGL